MRNRLLGALLLLAIGASLAGQTSPWKTYRNIDGNLSVSFPGDPEDSINKTEAGIQSHNLMVQTQNGVYLVVYSSMAPAQPVNEATFQVFKNGVFSGLPKCNVNNEQAASPAMQDFVGRFYQATCEFGTNKVVMEGNLYWGKHYAYAVLVMNPSGGSRLDGAKKFFDSFTVIDLDRVPSR